MVLFGAAQADPPLFAGRVDRFRSLGLQKLSNRRGRLVVFCKRDDDAPAFAQGVFIDENLVFWKALGDGFSALSPMVPPTAAPAAPRMAAPSKPSAVIGPSPGTRAIRSEPPVIPTPPPNSAPIALPMPGCSVASVGMDCIFSICVSAAGSQKRDFVGRNPASDASSTTRSAASRF